jgi:hypothetical protein
MADEFDLRSTAQRPDLTPAEKIIESGLRLYDRFANRAEMPTNRRIFLETVLDRSRQPITEQSFRPEELQYIRELVMRPYTMNAQHYDRYGKWLDQRLAQDAAETKKDRKLYPEFRQLFEKQLSAVKSFQSGNLTQDFIDLASGKQYVAKEAAPPQVDNEGISKNWADYAQAFKVKPAVTYESYALTGPSNVELDRRLTAGQSPREAVHLTLGRFAYGVDPNTGNLVVRDKYDFNPPDALAARASPTQPIGLEPAATSAETFGAGSYGILRQFAGRVTPPGQGRNVLINLPRQR